MNEAEKKLREAWAKAGDGAKQLVCEWNAGYGDGYNRGVADLGSAVRAFCESEPERYVTLMLTQFDGVEAADLSAMLNWVRQRTPNDASPMVVRLQNAAHAYMREIGVPAVVEPEALRRALFADLQRALVAEEERDSLRAKVAAAEKERDELRGDHRYACEVLSRTSIELGEAKREAEAMRDLATRNANELNAAQRSYRAQLGELTRALEAEKTAHSEALRPDEYTRAAVACAEALADARVSYSDFEPIREQWVVAYKARQRGEPSAPVSPQPPARVLECWVGEYDNGFYEAAFISSERAFRYSDSIVRAYKVAMPVIETVERGA